MTFTEALRQRQAWTTAQGHPPLSARLTTIDADEMVQSLATLKRETPPVPSGPLLGHAVGCAWIRDDTVALGQVAFA